MKKAILGFHSASFTYKKTKAIPQLCVLHFPSSMLKMFLEIIRNQVLPKLIPKKEAQAVRRKDQRREYKQV